MLVAIAKLSDTRKTEIERLSKALEQAKEKKDDEEGDGGMSSSFKSNEKGGKDKKVEKAGLDSAMAAPCQSDHLDVSYSDHSAGFEQLTSWRVGWLGAAAAGSIPAFSTCFSFSSSLCPLSLFFLSTSTFFLEVRKEFVKIEPTVCV